MRLLIFIYCCWLFSCTDYNKLQENIALLKNNSESFEEAKFLKGALKDTISSWIKRRVSYAYGLRNMKWEIDDIVCVNIDKNKAVLLCLTWDSTQIDNPDVWLFFSRKVEDQWKFYGRAMPNVPYGGGKSRPSMEDISTYTFAKLIDGGLIIDGKINDEWINGWDRDYLDYYQERFINDIQEI